MINAKENNRDFYPNVNPDTYEIDGTKLRLKLKLKTEKECVMKNLEHFRVSGECVFGNVQKIARNIPTKSGDSRDRVYGFCAEAHLTTSSQEDLEES